MLLSSIRPQVFINITSNVFSCHAPGEEPSGMSYPSLAVLWTRVLTSGTHGSQKRHLIMWVVITHFPHPGREKLIYWVEEGYMNMEAGTKP